MHADFSFSYLRFAEAASFDKKELRRSCTLALIVQTLFFLIHDTHEGWDFSPFMQMYLSPGL